MSRSFELQDLRWPYLELLSTSSLEYPEFLASCLAIQAYCHDSLQYFLPLFKLHSVFFFWCQKNLTKLRAKRGPSFLCLLLSLRTYSHKCLKLSSSHRSCSHQGNQALESTSHYLYSKFSSKAEDQ